MFPGGLDWHVSDVLLPLKRNSLVKAVLGLRSRGTGVPAPALGSAWEWQLVEWERPDTSPLSEATLVKALLVLGVIPLGVLAYTE